MKSDGYKEKLQTFGRSTRRQIPLPSAASQNGQGSQAKTQNRPDEETFHPDLSGSKTLASESLSRFSYCTVTFIAVIPITKQLTV